jgi:drug/metabolite transporter (DMT)-like permease
MLLLAAKIGCSIALAVILRHGQQAKLNLVAMIRINYAAAAILAFFLSLLSSRHHIGPNTLWVAILAGVSYAAAMLLWVRAMQDSGIALTTGLNRLSIMVPILCSAAIWHEIPKWFQSVGAVLGLGAAVLIGRQKPGPESAGRPTGSRRVVQIGMFLAAGVAALSSKLFNELCPADDNLMFQALLFVTAFVCTTLIYYVRKDKVDQNSLAWGAAFGAINLGSSVFMVLALVTLPGTIAFPVAAAVEVAVIALLGRSIWREKLDRLSILGLALTVAALVLVNL